LLTSRHEEGSQDSSSLLLDPVRDLPERKIDKKRMETSRLGFWNTLLYPHARALAVRARIRHGFRLSPSDSLLGTGRFDDWWQGQEEGI